MSARRVVVADNDPEALDLVCIDLDLEGHDIVGRATDGETAVEIMVKHVSQLVEPPRLRNRNVEITDEAERVVLKALHKWLA